MDQIRKEKIKASVIKTLKEKVNYPDCEAQQVLNSLKDCWLKLEEEGLVDGMSYKAFVEHAQTQAMLQQMKGVFGL